MKTPPEKLSRVLWSTLFMVVVAFLVFRRGAGFLLPLLIFIPFWFWGSGQGGSPGMGREDPSDWWKKGKRDE